MFIKKIFLQHAMQYNSSARKLSSSVSILCPCVKKISKMNTDWLTRTTFHPPITGKLFELIKNIVHFVLVVINKEAQSSLCDCCLSLCLSVFLSIYLSFCLFVCLSVYLSAYLSQSQYELWKAKYREMWIRSKQLIIYLIKSFWAFLKFRFDFLPRRVQAVQCLSMM